MKQRREGYFDLVLRIAVLGICLSANAQDSAKIPTLGYLSNGSAETVQPRIEPFRLGLRELGYVEGKNVSIVYRYAHGQSERLLSLAKELVRAQVAIIIAPGTETVQAAKEATHSIPIVFPGVADPVAFGFVASLARPGGNIAGLTNYSPELSGKRVELPATGDMHHEDGLQGGSCDHHISAFLLFSHDRNEFDVCSRLGGA